MPAKKQRISGQQKKGTSPNKVNKPDTTLPPMSKPKMKGRFIKN